MKLFTRYNRINLLATVFIFLLASLVFYFFLRQVLVKQVDEDLEIEQTEIVAYANRYQRLPDITQQEDQKVFYLAGQQPVKGNHFKTISNHLNEEDVREILFSLQLPDGWRNIVVSKSLEGTDHLTRSVATIALATILLILIASFLVNRLVLRQLWKPFYGTLSAMQKFRISNAAALQLASSNIDEFELMNTTLAQTTQKAAQDYILLKEFTENASHELQTPLAIIRSKLELVIQEPLSKTQSHAVQQAADASKLLGRINRSLLLLAKIQNHQFAEKETVEMKAVIKEKLSAFEGIILDKEITVNPTLNNKQLLMNADLTGLLISNLLSNAIKHNRRGGAINISLRDKHLMIGNTGAEYALDESRLFARFYNPAKAENSTGLGLSIVQQICADSGFSIHYRFENGLHCFSISF